MTTGQMGKRISFLGFIYKQIPGFNRTNIGLKPSQAFQLWAW